MRIRIVGYLFVAVLLFTASGVANAQIDMKVTLPFAFQAEETLFPAGTYSISQSNPNSRLVIRNQKGRETGQFSASPLPAESVFAKDTTFLVFNKIDGKYFLKQVWSRHIGRQLSEPQAVKDARSSGKEVPEVKVNVKM